MPELHHLSASALVAELKNGHISSREVVQHYLSRIQDEGNRLGAFTAVFAEQALKDADAADRQTVRGPLHGLPIPLKDLHPSAGQATSMGSAPLKNWLPPQDGPVISRLRKAGAIFIAKTNAVEFGPACYTETKVGGNAETPYMRGYSASGSSGGAAAAVAARLAPVGHASDGLGSFRTPAANCGLVGFKPSRGQHPAGAQTWLSIGVEGPVARCVADAALFLDAIGPAGKHELWRAPNQGPSSYVDALTQPPGRLRIGMMADPGIEGPIDDECLEALSIAKKALTDLGHEVVSTQLPDRAFMSRLLDPLLTVMSVSIAGAVHALVPPSQHHDLMPFTCWLLEHSRSRSGFQFAMAQAQLAQASITWLRLQQDFDLILTPTTTAPARKTGAFRLDEGQKSLEAMLRWSAFTPWANLTGLPAVSLPMHTTKDGLPVGVQLIGNAYQDRLLISISAQLEEMFRWHLRAPKDQTGEQGK